MDANDTSEKMTRRRYLLIKTLEPVKKSRGQYAAPVGLFVAAEAVATTAIEHPEWDMDEVRTWAEWESR